MAEICWNWVETPFLLIYSTKPAFVNKPLELVKNTLRWYSDYYL